MAVRVMRPTTEGFIEMLLLPREKRSIPSRLTWIGVVSGVWWLNSPAVYELSTGFVLCFLLYRLLWDMAAQPFINPMPLRAESKYTV